MSKMKKLNENWNFNNVDNNSSSWLVEVELF